MDARETIELLGNERRRRGISFYEVARRAGWVNESIPRRLEREGANPTLASIRRYAAALGVEVKVSISGTRVISFFNHAGGVGKTSAARDMGYALSQEGFDVLLIDADPQANLTSWLGVVDEVPRERTFYDSVLGGEDQRYLPEPLGVHGMGLIPSSLELANLEPQLVGQIMGVTRLGNAIRNGSGSGSDYDFVLLDCPPSLGQLSALSVVASDYVVVPVATSIKGFQGINTVMQMISDYRQASTRLKVAMFLLTHYDSRTRHDRDARESLDRELASIAPVSEPLAERPAVYKDASMSGMPVPAYQPSGEAAAEISAATSLLLSALKVQVSV